MKFPSPLLLLFVLLIFIITGCKSKEKKTLFTAVDPSTSNINFENKIVETAEKNVMTYEYYYNGAGVAAADFNNDGLCDLYFIGNEVGNKLYLNKGGMSFTDITDKAGVKGRKGWKTGVTAVDINGDGWMDIYVSYSGPEKKENLYNELYINQGCGKDGIPVFVEMAAAYGLDSKFTFSSQAAFFDLDGDGDLDMFQCNHAQRYYSPFFNTEQVRFKRNAQFGNRLYRNDGGHFVDISEAAGIHGGALSFGLGVSISDVNNDGLPDIYVTNDFEEQDFLYLNKGNGTFKDVTKKSFGHLSKFAMGCDIADFNNDLLQDVLVVDMLPEKLERQKLLKGPDEFDKYSMMVNSGFHSQYMRNTLQLNQGNTKDSIPLFSEIGQLANIYNTDWSWSPLIADFDNDGYKDIFITNGFLRDFTNLDFLKYTYQDAADKARENGSILPVYDLIKKMPTVKLSNYAFKNNGSLSFTNETAAWGLDQPMVSNGAVYVDLDNDGDLDLVTNNLNQKATIWENHANELYHNKFIKVKLKGKGKNTKAIGAKVFVFSKNNQQVQELNPTRGYLSSVDYVLNFGLGKDSTNINIKVIWPNGTISIKNDVGTNKLIEFDELSPANAPVDTSSKTPIPAPLFIDWTKASGINFLHKENDFVDFKREQLIPYELSKQGPCLVKADVNNDGLDDFFIGGAAGCEGKLFIQNRDGSFSASKNQPFSADKACEDVAATFFDADGDGDMDLYVVSGSNEFLTGDPALSDRLYINDGKGNFKKAPEGAIPKEYSNGSCVAAADYDKDGDLDLFVGSGVNGGQFPFPSFGGILRNDTDPKTKVIKFSVATNEVNEKLKNLGMITDAKWVDINNDSWPDLIVVGEWMKIHIFINHKGKLEEVENTGLEQTAGLWSKIFIADFDGDGDLDMIVGNVGNNNQWKPTPDNPITMYAADFDGNGSIDPIICMQINGMQYPIASLDELAEQIPSIRQKFVYYKDFAKASMDDIFTKEQLSKATKFTLQTLQTSYIENLGNLKFAIRPLPIEAQFSKVSGILYNDYNHDGKKDILIAGNFFENRVQYGKSDASYGLLLQGDGKGHFTSVMPRTSGFYASGNVRDMVELKSKKSNLIVIGKNNDSLQVIRVKK
jgi:hypothetical protein